MLMPLHLLIVLNSVDDMNNFAFLKYCVMSNVITRTDNDVGVLILVYGECVRKIMTVLRDVGNLCN